MTRLPAVSRIAFLAAVTLACHGAPGAAANTDDAATAADTLTLDGAVEVQSGIPDVAADAVTDAGAGGVDGLAGDGDASVADAAAVTPVTTITVATTLALGPGLLHVRLIDYSTPVCSPTPGDVVVWNAAVDLPTQVTIAIPPGVWLPSAGWLGADGKILASSQIGDTSGLLTVLPGQYAPKNITVSINTPPDKGVCAAPPPNTFLSAASAFMVPFSNLGVSHLLEGLAWNGQWWMAANVEGIGRVSLPTNGKGVEGWTQVPLGDCRHLTRDNTRFFCSERGPSLKWMDIDPASNQMTQEGAIALSKDVHAEGMEAVNGQLYVALHEAGIALTPTDASAPVVTYAKGLVVDAWHVAALADGKVVVADGMAGVKVLAPLQKGQTSVLSQLALPGLCAHLAVSGSTVAIGALGGGLHLVKVDAAGKLALLGTLPAGPWPVAGVDIQGDKAYLAAGRALLAVPIPAAPLSPLGAVSATLTESFMSLDVRAFGDLAFTAEYAYVRALKLAPTPPAAGPIIVHEQEAWGKLTSVGQKVAFEVWLWNPGAKPLQLKQLNVSELDATVLPATGYDPIAPQQVAPGASVRVVVNVTKTKMGPQQWLLNIETDDPARLWAVTKLTESPLVRVGDPLPPLSYADETGKLQSVQSLAAGKPLLLIISAETCPVSFERLAAVAAHAQPWLNAGKIAAVAINSTDAPTMKEIGGFKMAFPELFATLTSPLVGGWSEVADSILQVPGQGPIPPLPLVYVVDAKGAVVYANLGYAPAGLQAALELVGGK